jgi:hypothetical protein
MYVHSHWNMFTETLPSNDTWIHKHTDSKVISYAYLYFSKWGNQAKNVTGG